MISLFPGKRKAESSTQYKVIKQKRVWVTAWSSKRSQGAELAGAGMESSRPMLPSSDHTVGHHSGKCSGPQTKSCSEQGAAKSTDTEHIGKTQFDPPRVKNACSAMLRTLCDPTDCGWPTRPQLVDPPGQGYWEWLNSSSGTFPKLRIKPMLPCVSCIGKWVPTTAAWCSDPTRWFAKGHAAIAFLCLVLDIWSSR